MTGRRWRALLAGQGHGSGRRAAFTPARDPLQTRFRADRRTENLVSLFDLRA